MIPNETIDPKALYERKEAAILLGKSGKTIDRWCEDRKMDFGMTSSGKKIFYGQMIIDKLNEIKAGIVWVRR